MANFYILTDEQAEEVTRLVDIARNVPVQRHDEAVVDSLLAALRRPHGTVEADWSGTCPTCGTSKTVEQVYFMVECKGMDFSMPVRFETIEAAREAANRCRRTAFRVTIYRMVHGRPSGTEVK